MQRPFPAYDGDEPYVFVCYAHDDKALVYPELTRLKDAGFHLWYDEGIAPGSEWSETLAQHIQRAGVFLYFVTPRSVESEHCRAEVAFAQTEGRRILAVHLEPTSLPAGLKLTLSYRQAILKYEHPPASYEAKLARALREVETDDKPDAGAGTLNIGDWQLDIGTLRLSRGEESHVLDPKQLSVLLHLVDRAPEVVTIEGLLARTWPDVVVGDNVVHQAITHLRRALGDDARHPTYIETLPRRGYRLLIDTRVADHPDPEATERLARSARGWIAAAVAVVVVTIGAYLVGTRTAEPPSRDLVVEVTRFADQSADGSLGLTAAGLHDELIDRLAEYSTLTVTERPAGGAYHLGGSLRLLDADHVRITARISDANDRTVWSETYDRATTELAGAPVEIATLVWRAMGWLILVAQEGHVDSDAVLAFFRGLDVMTKLGPGDAQEALGHFQQAVAIAPNFAFAWEMIATVHIRFAQTGAMSSRDAMDEARAAHAKAVALAPGTTVPAFVGNDATIRLSDGDFAGAEADYQTALASDSPPLVAAAQYFAICGRFDEALPLSDRAALTRSPMNLRGEKVQILWLAGRYEEGLALADEILAETSHDARTKTHRALILLAMGRTEEALEAGVPGVPNTPDVMEAVRTGGIEALGRIMLEEAERLESQSQPTAWRAYFAANTFLGNAEEAVRWLRTGWELGDPEVLPTRAYPIPGIDVVRAHPAYAEFNREVLGDPPTCPGPASRGTTTAGAGVPALDIHSLHGG